LSNTPKFIAEVSSNHHQDLDRSLQFIETAAEIGCDAVKFQLFKIDQLFATEILEKSEKHRRRKEWELPLEFLPPLSKRAKECGIEFSCTPFYIEAIEELEPYVDFYKMASYELLWKELISACAATGKQLILSTGMATVEEIAASVDVARKAGCEDLSVLHCISGYPTPVEECNLAAIETLREHCHCPVGWSDHSVVPAVINRAINRWDACAIEFHLDLDGEGEEFAPGHCWLPGQMKDVIDAVKAGYVADGTGEKVPSPTELSDRDWRADPEDGLRPMKFIRDTFQG